MSPACYAELMSLQSSWGCCSLRAMGAEALHCMQRAEAAHLAASSPPGQPTVACFLDAHHSCFSQLKAKMPSPATSQRQKCWQPLLQGRSHCLPLQSSQC